MLTDAIIAEGLRLDAERTPGLVRHHRSFSNDCEVCPTLSIGGGKTLATIHGAPYLGFTESLPNAAFLAHAANHYADALREVQRLRDENEQLRHTIEGILGQGAMDNG